MHLNKQADACGYLVFFLSYYSSVEEHIDTALKVKSDYHESVTTKTSDYLTNRHTHRQETDKVILISDLHICCTSDMMSTV